MCGILVSDDVGPCKMVIFFTKSALDMGIFTISALNCKLHCIYLLNIQYAYLYTNNGFGCGVVCSFYRLIKEHS